MDFDTVDTPTLKAWHGEALAALQALSIGRREVSLSYSAPGSSRSGSYTAADRPALMQWIGQLADALRCRGEFGGEFGGVRPRRRAFGFRF